MSLIIKKNTCLVVFLLASYSFCLDGKVNTKRRYSLSTIPENPAKLKEFQKSLKLLVRPVSWIESLVVLLNGPPIRNFLFESLSEICDYVLV